MDYLKEIIEFVFSIALFFNALLFIPQAVKIFKTKSAQNISFLTFIGFLLIQFATVLYGVIKNDHFLIIGYLVSMLSCSCVIGLAFFYKKRSEILNKASIALEEIINQLPGHIYWKNKDGVCLGANKNNWEDFGCKSLADFIGKTDYDLFPKAEAERLRFNDEEVMRAGQLKIVEEESTISNGKKILYLSHKLPLINKMGEIIGILGTSVDITKSKQETTDRLEMLENIISLMPGHVYWLNRDGVYQGCNEAQANSIGLSSRKEIVGKRNVDIPGFLIPEVLDPINEEVMRSGKTITAEEPAVLLDGTLATFFSTKTPLYNHNHEIIGMVGISVDITDRKKVEELQKHKEQAEKIREITAHVAHDIRSPLTSLQVIIRKLSSVDEETRTIIRNATNRINDIANNLVIKYGATGEISPESTETILTSEIISCLVDNLLSEKRAQYADTDINFELTIAEDAECLFAKINPEKFKRVLSNIINNSVEGIAKAKTQVKARTQNHAKTGAEGQAQSQSQANDEAQSHTTKGSIKVTITKQTNVDGKNNFICIQVNDNGCGIPKEIMQKIGFGKVSTKNDEGHGIGLFTAIQQIEAWGGKYTIESELNSGVNFTICLPQVTPPSWFQENLEFILGTTFVILDDDQSIHDIWDSRFKEFADKIFVKHYTNANSLLIDLPAHKVKENVLYLIDYELLGSGANGLDVIKKLDLSNNVFLVTSRYEDYKIKGECAKLKIKIIPKNYAPFIALILNPSAQEKPADFVQPDYIFIDDDDNLIAAWKLSANLAGLNVATFNSPRDFEKIKVFFNKDIPLYVDYQMGLVDGITYSKQLSEEGFTNIYLATGHDKSYITTHTPWLKDIVGKEPPFLKSLDAENGVLSTTCKEDLGSEAHTAGKSQITPHYVNDKLDEELWKVWRSFHHDLMSGPVSLCTGLETLIEHLPKLLKSYRKEHPKIEYFDKSGIDQSTMEYFETVANGLPAILKAHMWNINLKRMQLVSLNSQSFPLKMCDMASCINKAITEFPAAALHKLKKPLPIPNIESFAFTGNEEIMKHILFNLLDISLYGMRSVNHNIPDKLQILTTKDERYNYLHLMNIGEKVPDSELPKMFTKLFTTKMSRDGTGYGLYFCRKAMRYFGGDISYNPEAPKGFVEFVLKFPVK